MANHPNEEIEYALIVTDLDCANESTQTSIVATYTAEERLTAIYDLNELKTSSSELKSLVRMYDMHYGKDEYEKACLEMQQGNIKSKLVS